MKAQTPAQKQLREALRVFLFAHYIFNMLQKRLINKDQLPSKFDIKTGTSKISVDFGLNHQSTKGVAYNTIVACLGACVNTFDSVLEKTFKHDSHDSIGRLITKDNPLDDLTAARAIINQMRNAFAHCPEEPAWHVKNPNFQRVFQVKEINQTVDLQKLNGQPINPTKLGGYKAFFDLFKYCFDEVGKEESKRGVSLS